MEVARTSMIHAAAPIFGGHLRSCTLRISSTSLPETSPTLRWTGKVGVASVFRVRGSRALVCDTSAEKLSARAIPCDVTFDESVPFYRLFPFRSAPPPPPPLFLAPGPPLVDPLPPQGPAPSGVSQVDPLPGAAPVEVAVGSVVARGATAGGVEPGDAESEGAGSGGAELGGAKIGGAELGGVEPEGVELGGADSEGAESRGAEPQGAALSRGPAGASPSLSPRLETLSSQQLHEWLVWRARLRSGATGAGGTGVTRLGGAGVTVGAGGTGGAAVAGPGGARTWGTGAAGTGGVGGFGGEGAGDPTEHGGTRAGGTRARGAGAVDPGGGGAGGTTEPGAAETGGAGGAGVVGAGTGGTGARGDGAGRAGAVDPGAGGAGGTVQPRPYFVPRIQQVLGVPSSTGLPPPLLCPMNDLSQPPLQKASPLRAPSPYTEQFGGLIERREPASRPVSSVRTTLRVPCLRPPPVPGTHAICYSHNRLECA
ncbi:unnamed protein product [Closterium sp. NIES-53]